LDFSGLNSCQGSHTADALTQSALDFGGGETGSPRDGLPAEYLRCGRSEVIYFVMIAGDFTVSV
jgi:hypothetical protein